MANKKREDLIFTTGIVLTRIWLYPDLAYLYGIHKWSGYAITTIESVLEQLVRDELIVKSHTESGERNTLRQLYSITDSGKEKLRFEISKWKDLETKINEAEDIISTNGTQK